MKWSFVYTVVLKENVGHNIYSANVVILFTIQNFT